MIILLTSLWFGILTSISPCPLATNIAAVSFIGKKINKPYYVLLSGLFYTFGRTFLYVILGIVVSKTMQSIPIVSDFLQNKMMYFAAPIMIIIGVILLDIIKVNLPDIKLINFSSNKLEKMGLIGALFMGMLFAATFCPVSAALFFSNLITSQGSISALFFYGIGTGIPVLFFAFILAFVVNKISAIYKVTAKFEKIARIITGIIFIIVGLFYIGRYVL